MVFYEEDHDTCRTTSLHAAGRTDLVRTARKRNHDKEVVCSLEEAPLGDERIEGHTDKSHLSADRLGVLKAVDVVGILVGFHIKANATPC